jgi:hypothetical protein
LAKAIEGREEDLLHIAKHDLARFFFHTNILFRKDNDFRDTTAIYQTK